MIARFFQSLRGKLILTYTLVTVMALLVVEVLVLLFGLAIINSASPETGPYLGDVIYTLAPIAKIYLEPGKENVPDLQAWLESTYASGLASLDPQFLGDSPAAIIDQSEPMYVLSADKTVLAQAPPSKNNLVGRRYTSPDIAKGQAALDNAYNKVKDPLWLSAEQPNGNYLMAVPVLHGSTDPTLVGVIILSVKPPPPLLATLWPYLLGVGLFTAMLLLIGVAPFGALFGFIMSHGLTRRLKALTHAADAWGEGNFAIQPQDKSKDEISYLGMRMRRMAEHIQSLLQTQHELAMMEERNRLARELHDTVKQQTFATLMQVRAAKNLIEKEPETARQHLEDAENLIKTSQQELGLMIAELRPAALEGQGLAVALRNYLGTWSQHAHIPANFQVQNERKLPLATEQALYRVAQEALANVARHSRASQANVRLDYEVTKVCLTITDNGVGFDAEIDGKQGVGLQSMRERITALNGQLAIYSVKDEGTTLVVTIPAG